MEDGFRKVKIYPHHFEASKEVTSAPNSPQPQNSPASQTRTPSSSRSLTTPRTRRRLLKVASMLNMFSLPGLPWGYGKVELSAAEVESLRSEITYLEEREAHLRAQLEHLDELLKSARLAGYLYIRTRWTALPGEPPIEESDVDDWLPRFVMLHGSCIFFYLQSTDLSPQASTLLSDIVEVGTLPSFSQEDGQTRHSFFILTRQGLRFECSSISEIQMKSWLTALENDCSSVSDSAPREGH